MKKYSAFLFSFAFALIAIYCITATKKAMVMNHIEPATDADGRYEWELSRLADPATGKIPNNIRMKELAYAATLPNDADAWSRGERALDFTNRGPWNVGGRTRAFGVDVSDENRLLAGSCSGGMWLSTNGGQSWAMSNTLSQLKNATCLVQDTRVGHTNVWYYGSGEAYGASASGTGAYYMGDGLYKSVNGGVSWSPITSTAGGNPGSFTTNFQLVWNVANDVSANDTISEVYAATYGAIYRSINGGTSWSAVRSGGSYFTDVALTTTGVVYATLSDDGTQKGIWRSVDGITFTNITPSGFPTAYNRIVVGIDPNDENTVYFLANTPNAGKVTYDWQGEPEWNSFYKYTYVTGDGAGTNGTWQNLSMNLPNTGGQFDKWQVQGSYDMVVKVKPGNSNMVFIGGTNLYRSTSGFQDSTNTTFIGGYEQFSAMPVINSYPNHHPDQHTITFLPSNPNVMFSTNDGGVFKTIDNAATQVIWEDLNKGYLTTMFYTVAVDHATPNNPIIVAGAQDNGTWYTNSTDPTTPWTRPRGGDGSYCAIADNQSAYYFSIQNARMMRATLDAAGSITSFARIDPIGLKDPKFINPFVLDPNNNDIMYCAGGKYLWRNENLSGIPMVGNWDSISTNWTRFNDSIPLTGKISAVTVCKTPANRVYIGTDSKRVYRIDNANVGSPALVDITSTTTGNLFPTGNVSCIAVDPDDGNKLMVIFSNYGVQSIFYSTDAGTTWARCGGNLEGTAAASPSIKWGSIMPVTDGKLYMVATSVGVFATDTLKAASTVWVQQGATTIGNAVCDMIEFRQSDGLVVIATHANGVFSTNISSVDDITLVKDLGIQRDGITLNNYPNPFADETSIEINIKQSTHVLLQITDDCGRLIETIANTRLTEGKHVFKYTANQLKSGIYYCTLLANGRRKTAKMMLVK
jgi:Secretion system C-terminal sorting domain